MTEDDLPKRPPRQLDRARLLARLLDRSFRVPGTSLRFGLDPLLGLLPVGGDAISALASGYILYVAWLNGAPGALIGRMLFNLLVDTLVGAVPVVGDLFDAGWQANARNVALLEEWVGEEGSQRHHSIAILIAVLVALLVLLAAVIALIWVVVETLLQGAIGGAAELF